MKIKLHFDDIIYQLQKKGGVYTYWKSLTSNISVNDSFQIQRTTGQKVARFLPVYTNSKIFHSSYYRIAFGENVKNVITIHDFIDELGINKDKIFNRKLNILQMRLAINYADAIICISENTKKNLLSLYPKHEKHSNLHVIGHGASFKFDESLNSYLPDKLKDIGISISNRYILFVGKRVEYKNFKSAVLGFFKSGLATIGFSLICVGTKFSESEITLFSSLGLQNNVVSFENITDKELNYLYQNAFALIYPSLYEGFGLPPLEALSCGCPVIASNTTSIPEVVGDAGILINPYDTGAIASALERLRCDETRKNYITRGFTRAKLFSWEKVAKQYIEIYQSLANN
jgi:glycosyltransferase involved in cell wall biosynthesis